MDLNDFEIPDTAVIHLEFPTVGKLYAKDADGKDDLDKPVTISVFGPASDKAIALKRKYTKETTNIIAKKGVKGLSSTDYDEREIERLTVLTAGTSNLVYKGETIGPNNIEKIYRDPKLGWIKDQVLEKISSWDDFLA